MQNGIFFSAIEGGYRPLEASRGFWKHDSIKGRSIVGLLGYELERLHGSPGMIPVRLTVDMFRMCEFADVNIETSVISGGRRLKLVEGRLSAGGARAACATVQFLKPAQEPNGTIWSPAAWAAPDPETLPSTTMIGPARSFEVRAIRDRDDVSGPRAVWVRETDALVNGVEFTPFTRVAAAADFASPLCHISDLGVSYINSDITVHLCRLPKGEWIGMEVTGHEASSGIAVGNCRLYDREGAIGYITVTAIASRPPQ